MRARKYATDLWLSVAAFKSLPTHAHTPALVCVCVSLTCQGDLNKVGVTHTPRECYENKNIKKANKQTKRSRRLGMLSYMRGTRQLKQINT